MRVTTFGLSAALLLFAAEAGAFPTGLNDWETRYGGQSTAGATAGCQLCHANANGGSPWNAYGIAVLNALDDLACDLDNGGTVSNDEAFLCVELDDSDGDTGANVNLTEIVTFSSQPGWSLGDCNNLFDRAGGMTTEQTAPAGIGLIDPAGTAPVTGCGGGDPGPGPGGDPITVQVQPGESIQMAIDMAPPGSTILVAPGTYRETASATNGLNITKSLNLIGQSTPTERVIIEPSGGQRNGIVAVPANRTECMSCHQTMAPPFTLWPGVPASGDTSPVIDGLEIRGITIQNFPNNGLFTERVNNFKIIDVESIDNRNYGIFPTLSSNGIINRSRATGALDSGIWVETSEFITVTNSLVEGNVNGFEISNSDDIVVAHNVTRFNTVGITLFVLPDLVDERPDARRISVRNNHIHDNNRINDATPGSVLAFLPQGMGVAIVGADESIVVHNRIENNDFAGVVIADYCLAVFDTAFDCVANPPPPEFDPLPQNNRVMRNTMTNNGTNPAGNNPFAFAAADLTLFVLLNDGNCYLDNQFTTFFGFTAQPVCDGPGLGTGGVPILLPSVPSQPRGPGAPGGPITKKRY